MRDRIIKLQNFMCPKTKDMQENWWMFWRGYNLKHDMSDSAWSIEKNQHTEFFTYFNAFSLEKWKLYTNIHKIDISFKIKGTFGIQIFGHYVEGDEIQKEIISENYYEIEEKKDIFIPIPMDCKSQVVSYQIFAYDDVSIYEGGFYAEISEEHLNPVELSLVTVTFKKEDFITRNLRIIENEILYSEEDLANHLFVRVIDNGRTLDVEQWNSERLHIYPNPNVGGSGGYTRGMIESLEDQNFRATHVLLMDDDVKVLPESIIRTYNILRCVKPEYKDHFVSGAMLYYEKMHIQHEDVGFINSKGEYGPRKPIMEMHLPQSVIRNEKIYKDTPNNYAGWWYCCIPVWKMDLNRLPLPLFIRGDDVEFSIYNNAKFITLNGICIWHMGFVKKFNMPMEFYQVHRNSLIIQATSNVSPEVDYVERIIDLFGRELARYNYVGCDLLLDSIDDYMKGPEFIMNLDGEAMMKRQSSRVPKFVDAADHFSNICIDYKAIYKGVGDDEHFTPEQLKQYFRTYNWHLKPKFMMNHEPAVIAYDWWDVPEKQCGHDVVLAVNPHDKTAVLRYRSRREYIRLRKRCNKITSEYKKKSQIIADQYKKYRAEMTNVGFWKEYLER